MTSAKVNYLLKVPSLNHMRELQCISLGDDTEIHYTGQFFITIIEYLSRLLYKKGLLWLTVLHIQSLRFGWPQGFGLW